MAWSRSLPSATGPVEAVFPQQGELSDAIPAAARRYLQQAQDSIHAPDGAVMLAASAVDAMLKSKGYDAGRLYSRIRAAADAHLITADMALWSHQVRLEANNPRHADQDEPHVTPAAAAQAAYTVTLAQVGSNVVATGNGTLDLTGLEFGGHTPSEAGIFPSTGAIPTGPAGLGLIGDVYARVTGPTSFGSGASRVPIAAAETLSASKALPASFTAPEGYVSGNPLSDMSTYDNQTFASLGVTPGTYVWMWGSGATADTFTLQIDPVAAVPEPASLTLFGFGFTALAFLRRRRRAV